MQYRPLHKAVVLPEVQRTVLEMLAREVDQEATRRRSLHRPHEARALRDVERMLRDAIYTTRQG